MDLSTISTNRPTDINNISSKIDIKYLKERRSKRTYISGLHHFLTEEEIQKLILTLKKKIGAGVDEKDTDNGKEYGFQGDHVRKMKGYIMDNTKLSKDVFNA
jgi:translation initiation factor 1 (eIF-1/SUI1)